MFKKREGLNEGIDCSEKGKGKKEVEGSFWALELDYAPALGGSILIIFFKILTFSLSV